MNNIGLQQSTLRFLLVAIINLGFRRLSKPRLHVKHAKHATYKEQIEIKVLLACEIEDIKI